MPDSNFFSILICAFFIHLPFGFIGRRYERFSKPWARCLYVPIVMIIILRRIIGFDYWSVPYFIVVALAGQILGRHMGRELMKHTGKPQRLQ